MKVKSTLSHFGKPCRCLHFRRLEVIIIIILIHLDAPQQCKTCFGQFLCFLPESKCSSCLCNKKHDIYNNLSVFCHERSHTRSEWQTQIRSTREFRLRRRAFVTQLSERSPCSSPLVTRIYERSPCSSPQECLKVLR